MKNPKPKDYKRRKQGKTDYRNRLELLKSRKPRLVIRKSNTHIRAQLVDYAQTGDKVLASAFSKELVKLGWKHSTKSLPAAYLTGLLCAKKAGKIDAVADLGLYNPMAGTKLYAAIKGAIDGGLNVPVSQDSVPKPDRLSGAHIQKDAKQVQTDFEAMKKKIMGNK